MQVKLKTILAGPAGSGQPGQIIEVEKKHGRDLIAGGYAEEVKPAKVTELATARAGETAALTSAEVAAQANLQRIFDAEKAAELEAAQRDLAEKIAAAQAFIAGKEAELAEATDDAKSGLDDVLAAARDELAALEAQRA